MAEVYIVLTVITNERGDQRTSKHLLQLTNFSSSRENLNRGIQDVVCCVIILSFLSVSGRTSFIF